MTSSVAGDVAVITILGMATVARLCSARCHAKISIPYPLVTRRLWGAWDDAEAEGWFVREPSPSTLEIEGNVQTHQYAREGVMTTFEECETS